MIFDCKDIIRLKKGGEYAAEYEGYLAFFSILANAHEKQVCTNVPACWAPFILYLGHEIQEVLPLKSWDGDVMDWVLAYQSAEDKRHVVEMASTARPELVHALYLADTAWPCPLVGSYRAHKFVITSNGSFFRAELTDFMQMLQAHETKATKAVITACSAEKPYPSETHDRIKARLPEDWDLMIATSAVGLVPYDLWSEMPIYDAGLPYTRRCEDVCAWYFTKHPHSHVIVYADFMANAIYRGLGAVPNRPVTEFLFGEHPRDTYENLSLDIHLMRLSRTVEICERGLI